MSERDVLLDEAAWARDHREYDKARDAYTRVLEHNRDGPDLMWALSHAEFALAVVRPDASDTHGRAAIGWLRKALAQRSNLAHYHASLGMMLQNVPPPDYQSAADAYRAALAIEPGYVPALVGLGFLYEVPEHVVSLSEAISCCEHAIRVSPTRSLWIILSRIYAYASRGTDSQRAREQSTLWPTDLY